MLGYKGPAQPSPTICDALNAGSDTLKSAASAATPIKRLRWILFVDGMVEVRQDIVSTWRWNPNCIDEKTVRAGGEACCSTFISTKNAI
jgi:hypothetical protein